MNGYKILQPNNRNHIKIFLLNDIHLRKNAEKTKAGKGTKRKYFASPNNLRHFVHIANEEQPDLVLLLGDVCDQPSDWPLFKKIWSSLSPDISHFMTLGNHDLDDHSYAQLKELFFAKDHEEVAGSAFNQAFEIGNTLVIVLDTTFDDQDQHGNHYKHVRMHSETLEWLKGLLHHNPLPTILIGSHAGPHLMDIDYFDQEQAKEITDWIEKFVSPHQQLRWVFGHYHVNRLKKYNHLGPMNKGVLLPAVITEEKGFFTELLIEGGHIKFKQRELPYQLEK